MIGVIVRQSSQIVPELILIAVGALGIAMTVAVALIWDKEPWWRTMPKPKAQVKNARDQIKIWKLQKKYPEAFDKIPDNIMKDKKS